MSDNYVDGCTEYVKYSMDGWSELSMRRGQQMMSRIDDRELRFPRQCMIVTTVGSFLPSTRELRPTYVDLVLGQDRRTSRNHNTVSKYCSLINVGRYSRIQDLPPSLVSYGSQSNQTFSFMMMGKSHTDHGSRIPHASSKSNHSD